jgi:hypothetical protein
MNKLKYLEIHRNISLFLCISICCILLIMNDMKIYQALGNITTLITNYKTNHEIAMIELITNRNENIPIPQCGIPYDR